VLKFKTKISRKGKSKLDKIIAARISELLSLQLPWRWCGDQRVDVRSKSAKICNSLRDLAGFGQGNLIGVRLEARGVSLDNCRVRGRVLKDKGKRMKDKKRDRGVEKRRGGEKCRDRDW
jgi:hypothetical protein